jgi:[ribosomal protein S5]-alanine N-acetyltransferase
MLPPYITRPQLEGQEIYLRLLDKRDAPALLRVYSLNRHFLTPWEPTRDTDFYTLAGQERMIGYLEEAARQDEAYSFGIFHRATRTLIGRITLSSVQRGIALSANLGYFLAEQYNGRGYTTDAVRLVLRFAFEVLGLHRVQAATLLHNIGSQRVLAKAGFRQEGLALRYLKINDEWSDHYLFGITVEEF